MGRCPYRKTRVTYLKGYYFPEKLIILTWFKVLDFIVKIVFFFLSRVTQHKILQELKKLKRPLAKTNISNLNNWAAFSGKKRVPWKIAFFPIIFQ